MTRISSLLVASTLAILPISAFAQQTVAPAKTAPPAAVTTVAPAGVTTAAPAGVTTAAQTPTATLSAPGTVKTAPATTADASKAGVKTPVAKTPAAKPEVHGMNTVKTHHAKAHVPAKTAEPVKS